MAHLENCLKGIYKYSRLLNKIDSFCLTVNDKNTNLLDTNKKLGFIIEKISCLKELCCAEYTNIIGTTLSDSAYETYEKSLKQAVSIIPLYVNSNETRLRVDVILCFLRLSGYFAFVRIENDSFKLYVYDIYSDGLLKNAINYLSIALKSIFNVTLEYRKSEKEIVNNDLNFLINRTNKFFVEECGEWINEFTEKLADTISKESFVSYLKQRAFAYTFDYSDICYPVMPPKITKNWRDMRENTFSQFPVLKNTDGSTLANTHYKYVYVYDQYSIENVVEAKKGDTVADVGAFIGDTSLYFGKKVGESGKVYAFEISSKSIEVGNENMKNNGINNVVFVNKAVSDKIGTIKFNKNNNDSMNCIADTSISYNGDSFGEVETVSLDEFFLKKGKKLNFIKADIEGAEMLMLKGAKETIKTYKPILAICLYHKKYDFIEIPKFISTCCSDYKFFFRSEAEPVLFAMV